MPILTMIVGSLMIAVTSYFRTMYGEAPWYLVFPSIVSVFVVALAIADIRSAITRRKAFIRIR